MFYANHSFKDWFFSTPYQRRQWINAMQVNNSKDGYVNHDDPVTRFIENRPVKKIRSKDVIKSIDNGLYLNLSNELENDSVRTLINNCYKVTPFDDKLGYDVIGWGVVIFRVRLMHDKSVALVYRRDFEIAGRLNMIVKVPTNVVFQTIVPLAYMLERSDFKEKVVDRIFK